MEATSQLHVPAVLPTNKLPLVHTEWEAWWAPEGQDAFLMS